MARKRTPRRTPSSKGKKIPIPAERIEQDDPEAEQEQEMAEETEVTINSFRLIDNLALLH